MSEDNVLIGNDDCPYCVKVKSYFNLKKIPFKYINTLEEEGAKIRKQEAEKYNWKTIPLVFIQGKFIGGCDDFFKALRDKQINFGNLWCFMLIIKYKDLIHTKYWTN